MKCFQKHFMSYCKSTIDDINMFINLPLVKYSVKIKFIEKSNTSTIYYLIAESNQPSTWEFVVAPSFQRRRDIVPLIIQAI